VDANLGTRPAKAVNQPSRHCGDRTLRSIVEVTKLVVVETKKDSQDDLWFSHCRTQEF
jgi:hypothetical protein